MVLTGASRNSKPEGERSEDSVLHVYDAARGEERDRRRVVKSEEEWHQTLTPEQFEIARKQGTERAYTGIYDDWHQKGWFKCAACGNDLFSSEHKFDSKTGWPSFWKPIDEGNVGYDEDTSLWMKRTEVHCSVCGAHLGHVFSDGPPPTGKRYCINSAILQFQKAPKSGNG